MFAGRAPASTAGGKAEFPVALADGEVAADGVADKGGAATGGLAVENRDEVIAVFAADVLACLTGDGFERGKEVGVAGHRIGLLAGLDGFGPTNNEWDAVSAFIEIGLVPAEPATGIVTVLFQDAEIALRGTAVVGSEDDEGILIDVVFL